MRYFSRVSRAGMVLAFSTVAAVVAMASPATAATTVSATVGPVAVPGVPVNVCVDNGTTTCTPTPAATTVSLAVSATVNPDAITPPTVIPGTCSNGQGVALVVTTGSAGSIISGSVTLAVNGNPTIIPIAVPSTGPNQTVIISACVAPGVGVPTVPGVPGVPALPGVPGVPALPGVPGIPAVPGLISGVLNALLGLLGGVPAAPALPGLPL